MATWKLGTFIDGAIIDDNLSVSNESTLKISYRGDDEAEISIPIYALSEENQTNWQSYTNPMTKFIACVDDENNILFAGPIIKNRFNYKTQSIDIIAQGFNAYLKKLKVKNSPSMTTVANTKTTYTVTGTALAIAQDILDNVLSDTLSPTCVEYTGGSVSTPSFTNTITLAEMQSVYDALDDIMANYDGFELKFTPAWNGSSAIKWVLQHATATSGNSRFINQALSPIEYDLDDTDCEITDIEAIDDASEMLYNRIWLQSTVNNTSGATDIKATTASSIPAGTPLLENFNAFDQAIDATAMSNQANAYLTDGQRPSRDLTIKIKAEDKSFWVENIGRRIKLIGTSPRAKAFSAGNNIYRVLEANFNTTQLEIDLVVQNLRSVKYPRLPRPKLDQKKTTNPKLVNGGNNTPKDTKLVDTPPPNYILSANQTWGDVPKGPSDPVESPFGTSTYIIPDLSILKQITGEIGIDAPIPSTINIADNGHVYGLGSTSQRRRITTTPMYSGGGLYDLFFTATPPSSLDTSIGAQDINVYHGHLNKAHFTYSGPAFENHWDLFGTIPAAKFNSALYNWEAKRTVDGHDWYIVWREAVYQLKVKNTKLYILITDRARYSEEATSGEHNREYWYSSTLVIDISNGEIGSMKVTPGFIPMEGANIIDMTSTKWREWYFDHSDDTNPWSIPSVFPQANFFDNQLISLNAPIYTEGNPAGWYPNTQSYSNTWNGLLGGVWTRGEDTTLEGFDSWFGIQDILQLSYRGTVFYAPARIGSAFHMPYFLAHADLDNAGKISALQYVWGPGTPNADLETINDMFICNGTLFMFKRPPVTGDPIILMRMPLDSYGSPIPEAADQIPLPVDLAAPSADTSRIIGYDGYIYQFSKNSLTNEVQFYTVVTDASVIG